MRWALKYLEALSPTHLISAVTLSFREAAVAFNKNS